MYSSSALTAIGTSHNQYLFAIKVQGPHIVILLREVKAILYVRDSHRFLVEDCWPPPRAHCRSGQTAQLYKSERLDNSKKRVPIGSFIIQSAYSFRRVEHIFVAMRGHVSLLQNWSPEVIVISSCGKGVLFPPEGRDLQSRPRRSG